MKGYGGLLRGHSEGGGLPGAVHLQRRDMSYKALHLRSGCYPTVLCRLCALLLVSCEVSRHVFDPCFTTVNG
jgi:hypothetical protein